MLNKQTRIAQLPRGSGLLISILVGLLVRPLQAADVQLPSLKIGTDVFTNVTVYQVTQTDIFVRHERGFGNAKISGLDDNSLRLLGLKTEKQDSDSGDRKAVGSVGVEQVKTALSAVNLKFPSDSAVNDVFKKINTSPQLLYGVLAGIAIGYLFYCLCLLRVCVNAGSKPGVLVWLPVLQMFPLLRAARMPAWWIIIFCVPVLNILAHLLWCARICRACGKGLLVAVLLFLPLTNVLAVLYLAFSGGAERPVEKTMRPEDLPGLAGA